MGLRVGLRIFFLGGDCFRPQGQSLSVGWVRDVGGTVQAAEGFSTSGFGTAGGCSGLGLGFGAYTSYI